MKIALMEKFLFFAFIFAAFAIWVFRLNRRLTDSLENPLPAEEIERLENLAARKSAPPSTQDTEATEASDDPQPVYDLDAAMKNNKSRK